ncbi:hypothetical protein SCHPADRAFT_945148 [Schizopora paradoxa]|uniref:Uncharacterized protein n=1 Tax=Schizopora paradoxa TaxID=27342 RepID=A0A0H2RRY3_9AGAM|nr:hypothetical protein SCHPADRAFT_945148 [Schizopora paradoxa]
MAQRTFLFLFVFAFSWISCVSASYSTVTAPTPPAPTVIVTPPAPAPVTVTADSPPPVTVTALDPDPSTTTVIPPVITLTVQVPINTITSTQASVTVTSSVSAFVQSFPPPSEVSSSEVTNNTVRANDPRITFMGNWTDSQSCDDISKRTTSSGSSMTFQFIGVGIYVTSIVGQDAGTFIASLDGNSANVDGFSQSADNCTVNWSSFDLDNILHTLQITYEGASTQGGGSSTAGYEFAHIVYSNSTSGGTGSTGSNSATTVSFSPRGFLPLYLLAASIIIVL